MYARDPPVGPGLGLVELRGFEPLTPCVQSRCSPTELQPHGDGTRWGQARMQMGRRVGVGPLVLNLWIVEGNHLKLLLMKSANGGLSQGAVLGVWGAPPPMADPTQPYASDFSPTDRPRRSHPKNRAPSLLPRKEVIQPHLPVQLPCYDFVPVISPTLGTCLPDESGLAQRLQVLPTSMT